MLHQLELEGPQCSPQRIFRGRGVGGHGRSVGVGELVQIIRNKEKIEYLSEEEKKKESKSSGIESYTA